MVRKKLTTNKSVVSKNPQKQALTTNTCQMHSGVSLALIHIVERHFAFSKRFGLGVARTIDVSAVQYAKAPLSLVKKH